MSKIAQQVIKNLLEQEVDLALDFSQKVKKICADLASRPLSHPTLLSAYRQLLSARQIAPNLELERLLKTRRVRTQSGVAPITVLTKPYYCPGKCIYCPLERGMPKSYLANEPAAQRAKASLFNPYQQVANRIKALESNGHEVDKLEIIILGGSWSAYPEAYRQEFVKGCFDGANGSVASDLASAQQINETARYRIIGLTIETRPDLITTEEIVALRQLGCTRVQLGAQHLDDKILALIQRGHNVQQLIAATKLLKQAGFKVDYHLMPDLPGTTPVKDLQMFKDLFSRADFQPDQIKIYPTVVNQHAPLYDWWRQGKYKPMPPKVLFENLQAILLTIPYYVRVNRLIRDIPAESIVAGNSTTNLRQDVEASLAAKGTPCHCMRCREVREGVIDLAKVQLFTEKYPASDGWEYFLSYESPGREQLYAFLRLRINQDYPDYLPELQGASLVRELHTYGRLAPVSSPAQRQAQHQGFGQRLMQVAEKISKEHNLKKIAVIAGIGVRQYYHDKLGYELEGTYMVKKI